MEEKQSLIENCKQVAPATIWSVRPRVRGFIANSVFFVQEHVFDCN